MLANQPQQDLVMQRHRPRVVAERSEDKVVSWHHGQKCHPPGDAPEWDSTVVSPNGMRGHPSPMGGMFGIPWSWAVTDSEH